MVGFASRERVAVRARARVSVVFAVALGVGVFVSARAHARPELALDVHVLKAPGRVLDVAYGDMDGDGREDLVVAHLKGDERDENGAPRRYVSVFKQGTGKDRWSPLPAVTRPVPADAIAFAVGDFDAKKGDDVVFVGARWITLLSKGKDGSLLGEVAQVASIDGFYEYPANAVLPRWDLAVDLGSGRKDLLAPIKSGYVVFKNDPRKGLVRGSVIQVPSRERFGPPFETKFLNRFLTYFSSMPKLCAIDLDGDKRKDLVVYRDRGLARFLQKPDGTFGEKPDDEKPLQVVAEAGKRGKGKRGGGGADGGGKDSEQFANVRLSLVDLDQDGFADLVATKTIGEIGVFETLRTQIMIWRGSKAGWNEAAPDRVIGQKGVATDPEFLDVDGDGKLDLVLSSLRMDYFTNVKRAITSSITITYSIYLQKDGFFGDEPDFTRDVSLDLDAIERRNGADNVSFEADLDGDKVHDMIVRSERGKLKVVPGAWDSGFFSGKTLVFKDDDAVTVDVPPNADLEVHDFYKDGKGDALVLTCPGPEDPEKETVRIIEARR
jgi:hypothetical protein